jgi:predicted Zn-dependent protease
MRTSQLVVLGLAIVMVGWFVIGAHQAHDISVATNILSQSGPVTAAEAAKTSSLLSSASTLDPDKEVSILKAALAASQSEPLQARRILETVGREEPLNINAWDLLAQVAGDDAKLEFRALAHVAELDPKTRPSS